MTLEKTREETDKCSSPTFLSGTRITALSIIVAPVWIATGIIHAGHETWVPIPLFGYVRWDVAIIIMTMAHVPLICFLYLSHSGPSWSIRWRTGAIFLICMFAISQLAISMLLPEDMRPMIALNEKSPLLIAAPKILRDTVDGVSVHEQGLSAEETQRLVDLTLNLRHEWNHVSMAQCLPYFTLGNSVNFDFVAKSATAYSLAYGYVGGSRGGLDKKLHHESDFRWSFPPEVRRQHKVLAESDLPLILRPVFARVLNTTPANIVFGNEIGEENYDWTGGLGTNILGMPGIGIFYPNLVWNMITNIHDDQIYGNKIRHIACKNADRVTTFLIPISAPRDAGLRFWTQEADRYVQNEVYYQLGKVYTFDASTLHTILPFPYMEWNRNRGIRMTIQAFGVQCDDEKWYLYH